MKDEIIVDGVKYVRADEAEKESREIDVNEFKLNICDKTIELIYKNHILLTINSDGLKLYAGSNHSSDLPLSQSTKFPSMKIIRLNGEC